MDNMLAGKKLQAVQGTKMRKPGSTVDNCRQNLSSQT